MSPATLTTTLLLTQFVLLLIVYFGILALQAGERQLSSYAEVGRPATYILPSWVFGFSLVTLACLVISQDFVLLSQPMFGDVPFPVLPREWAFLAVFTLDIFGGLREVVWVN